MSFSDKGTEEGETLLNSLNNVETVSVSDGNLSSLTGTDFQTLNDLSQELTLNHEMETEENEVVMETEEVIEHEEEVETEEVGTEEMEILIEQSNSHMETEMIQKNKTSTIPPLRPLTIAPKPAKIPLTVKPVAGQQLFIVQGGGTGQTIKLLSTQGQELNVAGLISRPVTLKPTFKTVQNQTGGISIVQQKPVVMKKLITPNQRTVTKQITTLPKQGQHFMVVHKDPQQLKLVAAQTSNIIPTSTTKTISLQQAQEMGLLGNTKIISQNQTIPKQTVLLKSPPKTLKLVPQVSSQLVSGTVTPQTKTISLGTVKTPTKILPAASVAVTKGPQRIIFKTAGTSQTIIPSGQIIQVAGSQALNTGQLHQINIPGKGMQYIKFVSATAPETSTTVSTVNTLKSSTASSTGIIQPITVSKIAPKPVKTPVTNKNNVVPTQLLVVPSVAAGTTPANKVPIAPLTKSKPNPPTSSAETSSPISQKEEVDANGIRPRKPCNCTKSQCLKLYCDCFANGEFCFLCNCMNCFNNLDNEEHRNRAIKACLERNPHAFKPKIGKAKDITGDISIRKHTKGCNCKRSGCLKNYCECYEAKIACSNNCKCIGCRNIEDCIEKKNLRHISSVEKATNTPILQVGKMTQTRDTLLHHHPRRSSSARKQTINFITDDVIEATCQCMLTISDNADDDMQSEEVIKRLIIEEFGRCLTEIIDCSSSRNLS